MAKFKLGHEPHMQDFKRRRQQGGKLIVSNWGLGNFTKVRTRLQIIEANKKLGTNRRVILHYDPVR